MRQSNWRLFIAVLLLVGITNVSHGQTDADFDSDGEVGFADFLMFAGAFNSTESKYDLNGNGTVDFPDFILLSGLFGQKAGSSDLTVTLSDSVQMAFVYISPGTFMMGSPNIVSEIGRERDELPQHEVTISEGFYLGKYEVTQAQWETVMGTTPWSGRSNVQSNASHPAVYVSWGNHVQRFIQRLNVAAGDSLYRLPTEAEWEYACRAGTTTRWSFGDDERQLANYAWYIDNVLIVGVRIGMTIDIIAVPLR